MKVYLQSLGCRLNQSEVETLARRLASAGHVMVDDPAAAELCVLNTCAVTAEAERKSRRRAAALARLNPAARLAVVGCYAKQQSLSLPSLTDQPDCQSGVALDADLEVALSQPATARPPDTADLTLSVGRTRAFLKVQDGCDNHCTYCIVRLLRGPARSRRLADVVADAQMLVEAGYREVVLTGVNLSAYGHDLGQPDGLYDLVKALLAHTDLPRLRLSSLEAWNLGEVFFGLWDDARLCRQLHIPLQAGCDATLRRMGRRVTTAGFARLVEQARQAAPGLAVTSDVIVGFPGEDEASFAASYDFVASQALARLHVFPYSRRPGTPAASLPGQIAGPECQARARAMRELGSRLAASYRQQFVGRQLTVLWEQRRPDGLWSGLTDNYLQVVARSDSDLHNQLTLTRLVAARSGGLMGEVIGPA